ncbi:VOC family protein [Pseudomonas sp. Fl5BN2]|uniref:VOC family protein n=1 Tax=Pseudomonas sp. Fl5BN2 TaxID=2697652 RepID=UPI001377B16C|nr:VOC family protein [Pseudomonas sp. Fl5BN2]
MLHHLSIGVKDLDKSGRFYDAALEALGFRRVFEDETAIGYGVEDGKDKLCLKLCPNAVAPGPGFHLAFSALSRGAVDSFHLRALSAGGTDNGAPGLRSHYGERYLL